MGIRDFPVAACQRVDQLLRLPLGLEQGRLGKIAVACRVRRPFGFHLAVDFVDGVFRAVHHHVHADIEAVLVVRGIKARGDLCAVLARIAGNYRPGIHDSRQLDLILDRAVLIEIPVKAVLVVADSGDERDDQAPGAAYFGPVGAPVHVFPEDPKIFFMHADHIRHLENAAPAACHIGIKVADLAKAVAAQLQCIRQHADPVLTAVKCVFMVMIVAGIAVRHDHIAERRSVHDRADLAAVQVADGVQHQPFTGSETNAERPLLPGDFMAADGKTRAIRLGDFVGFEVLAKLTRVAKFGDILASVVAGLGGQGNRTGIDHFDDFRGVQVEDDGDPFDRVRISIVARLGAQPGHRPEDAPRLIIFAFLAVPARRPWINHDQCHVSDTALCQGGLESGIGFDCRLALEKFVQHQGRLNTRDMLPANDSGLRE